MIKIIIAGCGQIGSRHLQALSELQESATIYLLDPSLESILTAEQRFYDALNDFKNPCKFSLIRSKFNSLPSEVDIAIIATHSSIRASVIHDIYKYSTPKNLILEKFLFDKIDDYKRVNDLIELKKTSAWTNQWISSSYPFKRIADWFDGKTIKIHVYAKEWGLACNCVHFIDFFDYMNDYKDLNIVNSNLDSEVSLSKRKGFFEFTGSISIGSPSGSSIMLESKKGAFDGTIKMKIESQEKVCNLIIFEDKLVCSFECEDSMRTETFKLPFQSNTTNHIVQDILVNNNSLLPTYKRSSYQHKLVFPIFENHLMSEHGQTERGCLVT